ncbi:MAG: DUF3667 domain-containing protein [Sphingomicrobium sp.]
MHLTGPYCAACGQHAHVHWTLGAFCHDLAHGVLHVEGRTWRTLPLLAWRPGELARRYIEGQRAIRVADGAVPVQCVPNVRSGQLPHHYAACRSGQDIDEAEYQSIAKLAALRQQRAAAAAANQPTAATDRQVTSEAEDLRIMTRLSRDGLVKGTATRMSDDVPAWLRDPIERAAANPDLTLYQLKSSAYKWSWALIPLSVPFLWLSFPLSRRFRMYVHTVFVTYSLSFMSLLVVALTIIAATGFPEAFIAALLIPPVHMYRQLKGAYALGRFGALWRTVALLLFAMIAVALFLAAMVVHGILD